MTDLRQLLSPTLLAGTAAFVTGGGSGINLAIAHGLASVGADVAICGRSADKLATAAAELRTYRGCFKQDRTARHFDTYCRGLLADLPRKTVEPIALASKYTLSGIRRWTPSAT